MRFAYLGKKLHGSAPMAADAKASNVYKSFCELRCAHQKERLLPYRIFPSELHKPIATVSPLIFKIKKPYSFEYSSLCLDYSPTG